MLEVINRSLVESAQDGVLHVQKDIHLYEQGFKAVVQRVKAPCRRLLESKSNSDLDPGRCAKLVAGIPSLSGAVSSYVGLSI